MFFSEPGKYDPCRMYSVGHIILFFLTFLTIILLLQHTKNSDKKTVSKIIRVTTIILWILEVIKIVFNLAIGNAKNPNNYLPFYYCSLILYAGLLSSFAKGKWKRIGDVFIATGSIIGGGFFLCCPNTSLTMYPMFHYISIQSFIFHGAMVYLGVLVNDTSYINVSIGDIKYYAIFLTSALSVSYIVNKILGTNFMFISKNFPNTPVEVIYNGTGRLFTFVMSILQITVPFYTVYILRHLAELFSIKNKKRQIN